MFIIIYFVLLFDSTKQYHLRQPIMVVKAIGKTIKSPIVKTFDNTIKNSIGMFRRNKNTIKSLACDLQERYLRTRNNFGKKPVNYLGEERIRYFKYTVPYIGEGDKQLVRAKGKKSIQMRSSEQIGRKELGSLINIVSRSKDQLPLLFVTGGLSKIIRFSLVPSDDSIDLNDHKDIEKNKQHKVRSKDKTAEYNRKYYSKNKDKIAEKRKKYYQIHKDEVIKHNIEYRLKNRNELIEKRKEYYKSHRDEITEKRREICKKNKCKIAEQARVYHLKNKEKLAEQMRKYTLENKAIIAQRRKKYYQDHRKRIAEKRREYYQNHRQKLLAEHRTYIAKNKDKLAVKWKEYKLKNRFNINAIKRRYYYKQKDKITERKRNYCSRDKILSVIKVIKRIGVKKNEIGDEQKSDLRNPINQTVKINNKVHEAAN